MSNEKHEEVAKELFEVTRQRNLASEQIIKSILSKHYDPEPELTKGMWTATNVYDLCVVTKTSPLKGLDIYGCEHGFGNVDFNYAPHTFTKPDLELLDTEVLDYVLGEYHDGNDTPFFVTVTDKEGSDVMTFYGFKTAHLAVLSAFNQRIEHEYFLRLLAVK